MTSLNTELFVWKSRWRFGTSSGWGSEGLVNVVGNTVGIGRKYCLHWVSKVVKAMVGAAERRDDIQNEWHISRKANYIYDVTFFGSFCEIFKKMLRS